MRCRASAAGRGREWPGGWASPWSSSPSRAAVANRPPAPPEGLPLRGGRPAALAGWPARARLSSPTHPVVVRPRTSTLRRQLPRRRRGSGRLRTPSQPSCERNPRRRPGRSVWPRSRRRMAACALAWLRYTGRTRLARAHPDHGYRRGAPSGGLQPLPVSSVGTDWAPARADRSGAALRRAADEATRLLRRGGLACDPFATCGRSAGVGAAGSPDAGLLVPYRDGRASGRDAFRAA
jgi:hypothetical protein